MSKPIKLPEQHFFLGSCQDIDDISAPLKQYGIKALTFSRNYVDGSRIYLTNNAAWTNDYFEHGLYGQFLSKKSHDYQNGYLMWPTVSDNPVFQLPKERYDSDNGITLIKQYNDYADFYFFSGGALDTHLPNFYVNNLNFLQRFALYFEDRAETILAKSQRHKLQLYIPEQTSGSIIVNEKINIVDSTKTLPLRRYRLKNSKFNNVKLASREVECVLHYLHGKTAKETAIEMSIAYRTVETYFDNIKAKLRCNTKQEVIQTLSDDGFLL